PPSWAETAVGEAGQFRITREGKRMIVWHQAGGQWHPLAETDRPASEAMVTGAKIWGSGPCGELEVAITRLATQADTATDQDVPPPFRPDPRLHGGQPVGLA